VGSSRPRIPASEGASAPGSDSSRSTGRNSISGSAGAPLHLRQEHAVGAPPGVGAEALQGGVCSLNEDSRRPSAIAGPAREGEPRLGAQPAHGEAVVAVKGEDAVELRAATPVGVDMGNVPPGQAFGKASREGLAGASRTSRPPPMAKSGLPPPLPPSSGAHLVHDPSGLVAGLDGAGRGERDDGGLVPEDGAQAHDPFAELGEHLGAQGAQRVGGIGRDDGRHEPEALLGDGLGREVAREVRRGPLLERPAEPRSASDFSSEERLEARLEVLARRPSLCATKSTVSKACRAWR
jgi:hypothetical protein